MEISFPSLFVSSLSVSLFLLILLFILKVDSKLSHCGISSTYLFVLLTILRGYMPLDFTAIHLTKSIYSRKILASIHDFVRAPVITIQNHSLSITSVLIFIWIMVGSILLLIKLIGYICYHKELTSFLSCEDEDIMYAFDKAYNHVFPNKKQLCRVIIYSQIPTPAVFGFWKYTILLPHTDYTSDELFYIFVHELLHIKHKDFLIHVFADLAISIHWWNPLITHYLPRLLRHIQELRVDYAITHTSNKEDKLCYLQCIQKSISFHEPNKMHRSTYALHTLSTQDNFKQRISLILEPSKKLTMPAIIVSFVLFVASFTVVFEASHHDKYDENGNRVYYLEGKSYYVENGDAYDLYLDGEYVYTTDIIISDFEHLPIYPNKLE